MLRILDFLSHIEQIAKINSVINNTQKFTKYRFDYKKVHEQDYSKIKLLKACRIKVTR